MTAADGGLLRRCQRACETVLPLMLISAEAELNAAAVAEGLVVDDPNAHP